jgi:hypothetical protein
MKTVAEIKVAIDQLSPPERCGLEALLHPDWDTRLPEGEIPPNVSQKLGEAAQGKFSEGDCSNVFRIISTLK